MDLTVLLPAKDEAESLPGVVAETLGVLDAVGIDGEVLVVDDGSTDATAEVVGGLARRDPRVRLHRMPRNMGRAHAIAAGLDTARGAAVAIMDSDGQYDPGDLPALVAALWEGADVANGRRIGRADSAWRRLVSWVYNVVLMRLVLGLRVRDANSGLKAVRRDALDALGFDPTGFARGHRYLVAWAVARGLEVADVPVRHRARTGGRSYIRPVREARHTIGDLIVFRARMRAPAVETERRRTPA